jgi:hypothetical protein
LEEQMSSDSEDRMAVIVEAIEAELDAEFLLLGADTIHAMA